MNVADVEPIATACDEDIGGDGVVEERFAALEVVNQDITSACMNGDRTRPAELGATNRQDRVIEVQIAKLQVQRLGDA
jgi:hypothetical protein